MILKNNSLNRYNRDSTVLNRFKEKKKKKKISLTRLERIKTKQIRFAHSPCIL